MNNFGMHSTDYGGAYRDSITCIGFDICSSRLSLFILCPNGRTYILNNMHVFATLDLPAYSTTDIMYKRLNYAITFCSSINGDSTGNNAFNDEDFDLDDINDDE
ncbi:unnamed protein product [Rotaria sordida]|uniref:Uncharacterized protein n=1 Tax=Rotaria sordida TaxID=392033 RepID=A0A814W7S1_9BILA|nr:unnamed protein product [Rotaria sordida]CAF3770336.1 unnamed protein product [Rotaria sordida]